MKLIKRNQLLVNSWAKGSFFITLLLSNLVGFSQLIDDFSDGDFTNNPTWSGSNADFIVNPTFQLQLNATVAGTSYLSLPHNLTDYNDTEWSFWVRQNFAGSASNFGRIYLTSTSADITTNPDGIYLQLGEALSTDAVRLMQRTGGVTSQICASADGTIANAFISKIKVVRNNAGLWSLNIDFTGGVNYTLVATGTESAAPVGTHFGYLCTYTSGNMTRFYLDDVYVGDEVIDVIPPTMNSVQVINSTQLDVLFSEGVTTVTAQNISNYTINPALAITSATINGTNPALVHLILTTPFTNGTTYSLSSQNIEDMSGNSSILQSLNFTYLVADVPAPGDVIINEFMPKETPVIGTLPPSEYVEIHNVSNKIFNITGWKLGDNSTQGTVQTGWLLPGQFVVLCPTSSVPGFTSAVGVSSFPSLNNSGDDISISDNTGILLDKITYDLSWYQDVAKQVGGWSIERINPQAPCSQASNWKSSIDPNGGTPGAQNSVYDITPDTQPASIVSAFTLNQSKVRISFNKPVDGTILGTAVITVNPTLTEVARTIAPGNVTSFDLEFSEIIQASQYYNITINGVQDCWGNVSNPTTTFALPAPVSKGDVVINEILFNQMTGGGDWIELYNKTDKLINLKDWKIARLVNGSVSDHKLITSNYFLKPHDYVVIGSDSNYIINNYPASVLGKFYQLTVPAMSNDTGSVIVTFPVYSMFDTTNIEMDRLIYSSKWHFKLIDDKKGKSLERIDPDLPTQDPNNWHTAAEAIGFATPGGKNSQYYPALYNGELTLSSETVSPDNDGFEDVLQINYQMNSPGMLATIKIFDDRGRSIKTVSHNELLGMSGSIVWDGIREDGQKATIGTYVILMEAVDINGGNEFVAKKAFVVAGKM